MILHSRIFFLLSMLALVACHRTEPQTQAQLQPAPAVAAPTVASNATVDAAKPEFPALVVPTFDGKTFDLSQHRGRWVVINYWATWCGPCLKEIPDLDAFDKSREDVDVVGLAYEEIERADMEAFLKDHPMSYPIAVLDVYKPPADFETPRGLPTTYLIAPDGKVAKHFVGPITSEDLLKAMNQHGQAPAA